MPFSAVRTTENDRGRPGETQVRGVATDQPIRVPACHMTDRRAGSCRATHRQRRTDTSGRSSSCLVTNRKNQRSERCDHTRCSGAYRCRRRWVRPTTSSVPAVKHATRCASQSMSSSVKRMLRDRFAKELRGIFGNRAEPMFSTYVRIVNTPLVRCACLSHFAVWTEPGPRMSQYECPDYGKRCPVCTDR